MGHDRRRIDTIKTNIADYSSPQLREIAEAQDEERWSAEARVAAQEILDDRGAGRAAAPLVAREPEPPPPPAPSSGGLLSLIGLVAVGAANGIAYQRIPVDEEEELDEPLPFGVKTAWLAFNTTNTAAVAAALGLHDARPAPWAEGVAAAYQAGVYITPPVADWTLAVGTVLFPPDRTEEFVKPLLERLSRKFGKVQYFCTHSDIELHVWARARKGVLVRGYGWLGARAVTLWDEGAPTKEECEIGYPFLNGPQPTTEQEASAESAAPAPPDESCVLQLAALWSIDPMSLDGEYKEPQPGLLGTLPAVPR